MIAILFTIPYLNENFQISYIVRSITINHNKYLLKLETAFFSIKFKTS